MPDRFDDAYLKYVKKWREADDRGASHDQLRHLFTSFLQTAFPSLSASEFELEKHVTGINVRGFIDLLYQNLIFEFKRDLEAEREDGLEELERYLSTQPNPSEVLGLLTDGKTFEVYTYRSGQLSQTDEFVLISTDPEEARFILDCYLFSNKAVEPSAPDIVRRFGDRSAVFNVVANWLREAYERVADRPDVRTKIAEWDNLLAHVYGTDVGTEALFIRHTYLAVLSRLLAFIALVGRMPKESELGGIVSGETFKALGVSNLVEEDFFVWILAQEVRSEAQTRLKGLAKHLRVYDFTKLDEDVLKELYQHLVDPVSRHDLGEYYTPDWLAERTLRELDLSVNERLLDPACGSGTFLFTAIRLARQDGVSGEALVRYAFSKLAGVDVHPLAVMIAKVNILLALLPDLRGQAIKDLPALPVFMADTLRVPLSSSHSSIEIPIRIEEAKEQLPRSLPTAFRVPTSLASQPNDFDTVLDRMVDLTSVEGVDFDSAKDRLRETVEGLGYASDFSFIVSNFRLLWWLIENDRDTVWRFILRNAFRPSYFAQRKFDVVAGNPPWLSGRYIATSSYQDEVKDLIKYYDLQDLSQPWHFSQMELATLFFVHSVDRFLDANGKIGFVMTRSVLTGAKQHRRFQNRYQFSRVLDLERVSPLFNVPACAVIVDLTDPSTGKIPMTVFEGTLPEKNTDFNEAQKHLSEKTETFTPLSASIKSSDYLDDIHQGAILVPRALWFVETPEEALIQTSARPQVRTDPNLKYLRPPWKELSISGSVEKEFLYATLLSRDLLPFGVRDMRLVVVPLQVTQRSMGEATQVEGRILTQDAAAQAGFTGLAKWLSQAETHWESNKKDSDTSESLAERLDYMQNLTRQVPLDTYKVVYNASGKHVASCVIDARHTLTARGIQTEGFVADAKFYQYSTSSKDEAHYLAGFLNAPFVNETIKPYQTRGQFGAKSGGGQRDIHRRPFEHLPLPRFDSTNSDHQELSRLSEECHSEFDTISDLSGRIGRARTRVRKQLQSQLDRLDDIVKRIL